MKRNKSKRRGGYASPKKGKSPRVAIVPASFDLRLGSHAIIGDGEMLVEKALKIAETLRRVLPENGFVTELPTNNPKLLPKKYVRCDGWVIAGQMLGVVPIEENCEKLHPSFGLGYKAVVRLERVCDSKTVGRASAICFLDEDAGTQFAGEEFATYSKTITRATGKAFRLTYGWLMKLAGFEQVLADELYEVEGSQITADDVAKRKIEEKLGQKFETLAHAEAALMDRKERDKQERATAKRSVFITWPEAHKGLRFLVIGRLVIWEHGLAQEVEGVCGGLFSDRDGGWFVSASHAPYLRRKITEAGIPIIETDWERAEGAKSA